MHPRKILVLVAALAASLALAQTVTTDPARTGIPVAGSGGFGTVTSVGVTTANGVSASVANATTTPALSFTLGAITPTTVSTGTVTATSLVGALTGNATTVTTNANMTGPITGTGNVTSITAQTGTGSVFVVQSSPTINTPTFVAPALGTPSSGVATNLTGTASGLTAGNVTTNANLTGPITSTGNATALAAQTGTGSVFVVQSSPTLNTATLVVPKVQTYTWAGKPAASAVASGSIARFSDVGPSPGVLLVSDGTVWRAEGAQVLARSAAPASGAADTNENTLATVTIPGGLLATNGRLRITSWWTVNNNANVKTPRYRWGGIGGTAITPQAMASGVTQRHQVDIINRNSASSQLIGAPSGAGGGGFGLSTGVFQTAVIDTGSDTTLLFTVQKATGSDTMTLEAYLVELLP